MPELVVINLDSDHDSLTDTASIDDDEFLFVCLR